LSGEPWSADIMVDMVNGVCPVFEWRAVARRTSLVTRG